jgi:hypothetical protein
MLQLEKTNHLGQVISDKIQDWRKAENTLMATVFGFAAYLPFQALLDPILQKARVLGPGSQAFPRGVKDLDIQAAELWEKLGDIKDQSQPMVNTTQGKGWELDALWAFKDFNLIIEAKKIGVPFSREQLQNYSDAFKPTGKPLWLLVVGKGSAAVRSLAGFTLGKDVNLLYINWETILGVVASRVRDKGLEKSHIRRCLRDIENSLESRDLKPFDGFFCEDKHLLLQSNTDIQNRVRENWFRASLWHPLTKDLSKIRVESDPWLRRPLWLLEQGTIKFSPSPWFTN